MNKIAQDSYFYGLFGHWNLKFTLLYLKFLIFLNKSFYCLKEVCLKEVCLLNPVATQYAFFSRTHYTISCIYHDI